MERYLRGDTITRWIHHCQRLTAPLLLAAFACTARATPYASALCHEVWDLVQAHYHAPVHAPAFWATCPERLPQVLDDLSGLRLRPQAKPGAPTTSAPDFRLHELRPAYLWVQVVRFNSTTATRLVQALHDRAQQAGQPALQGLILDVRHLLPGEFEPALALAAAFLPRQAQLLQLHNKTAPITEVEGHHFLVPRADPPALTQLPLALLIDRAAASGAEMIAGIWQEHRRAVVLGQRSAGNPTIQRALPLQQWPEGYLLLTSSTWTLPSGRSITGHGIAPDKPFGDPDAPPQPTDGPVALALHALESQVAFANEQRSARLQQARQKHRRHDRQGALLALAPVLAALPNDAPAWFLRTLIQAELGHTAQAGHSRAIWRLVRADPHAPARHELDCRTGLALKDPWAEVQAACERMLQTTPLNPWAWLQLGHTAALQGHTAQALRHYRTAMPMLDGYWPDSAQDMRADFQRVQGLSPQHAQRIAALQRFFATGLQAVQTALQPAERRMLGYMQATLAGTLVPEQSAAMLNDLLAIEARALPPDHPRVQLTLERLGSLYLEQKDWATALLYLEQARAALPDYPPAPDRAFELEQAIRHCKARLVAQ